jgi:heptaprenyl diphosphate synthase
MKGQNVMKTKKVATLGLCIALSMVLSFIEHQIPPLVAVPGVKVGLPNLVMVFMLYKIGWKETAVVSLIRVVLVSMLFGSVVSMAYGLVGATLSLIGMTLLKKTKLFSTIAVSVVGGVLHNIGQIATACVVMGTAQIVYYLPVLLISGTIAGVVIGFVSGLLVKKLDKLKF